MYDEILATADFETFLSAYDYDTTADPLAINWRDIYGYDPDVADVALTHESETKATIREALETDDAEIRICNLPTRGAGHLIFEDGRATTCPNCRGDLEYQNRVAVTCERCETQFDHFYSSVQHELCTTTDDGDLETVAVASIDDEKEIRADGGSLCTLQEDGCTETADGELEVSIGGAMTTTLPTCESCAAAHGVEIDSDDAEVDSE